MNNGKVWADGDVCLFPSRCMDDWQKFAWKKGDVLVSNEGDVEVIFDKWYDDTYTNFYGKHYLDSENENNIKYFEGLRRLDMKHKIIIVETMSVFYIVIFLI